MFHIQVPPAISAAEDILRMPSHPDILEGHSNLNVWMHCLDALFGCIIRMNCPDALSGCIVRMHCLDALSGCIVRMHCPDALSGCICAAQHHYCCPAYLFLQAVPAVFAAWHSYICAGLFFFPPEFRPGQSASGSGLCSGNSVVHKHGDGHRTYAAGNRCDV